MELVEFDDEKGEPTFQGQLRILIFWHKSDLIELLKNEDLS